MKREERIVSILTYIAASKIPCSATEITKELKITQSSVSRVLSSLETLQWVSRSVNGYTIGDQLLKLSFSITTKLDLVRVCHPFLRELQRLTNETIVLHYRLGITETCIDQVESDHSIRHVAPFIVDFPLWSGSSGKVILAYIDRDEREEVFKALIKSGIKTYPTGQPLDINKIREELEIIREQGYSITSGERNRRVASVGSPVFENNRVKGAIVITGPLTRFNIKTAQKFSSILVQTSNKISSILGSSF
jgi:DNA-binding IclR family transcriptional regulator